MGAGADTEIFPDRSRQIDVSSFGYGHQHGVCLFDYGKNIVGRVSIPDIALWQAEKMNGRKLSGNLQPFDMDPGSGSGVTNC